MPYKPTPILQLQIPDTFSVQPNSLQDRLNNDSLLSASHVSMDVFAGFTTGSTCFSIFAPITGSVMDISPAGSDGGSGILGLEYNRATDRVIQEVVIMTTASGSNPAGWALIDVGVQQGAVQPANISSIFAGLANQPVVSGSNGSAKPLLFSNFVSGSNTVWPRGTLMQAKIQSVSGLQAGLGAMRGLVVQVFWKPSGSAISYGA